MMSITSDEAMNRQATLNVGCVGHVAHGKSTLVRALSGVRTVRFRSELERNITIKLGYANAKIFKCESCPRPRCFSSGPSSCPSSIRCGECGGEAALVRHVSFVDCPGHEVLMATMLGGAAVMDAALLLVAADEPCPQPQTREHLAALEVGGQDIPLLVLQNKVDLVDEGRARRHAQEVAAFLEGTRAEGAAVLPLSAQLGLNMDAVCDHLARIPLPLRDLSAQPRMAVVRSFDINKPGCTPEELRGGVAGGTLLQGALRVGMEVELRPGLVVRPEEGGRLVCTTLRTRVTSLFAEQNPLEVAVPGGLIGAGTLLDPSLTRGDRVAGQVLGLGVPPPLVRLEVDFFLLRRLLGVAGKGARVKGLAKGETLMLNYRALSTGARVLALRGDCARLDLVQPVCAEPGEKVALSRRVDRHWRLVGWAEIRRGDQADEQ